MRQSKKNLPAISSEVDRFISRRRRSKLALTITLVIVLLSMLFDRLGAFGHKGDDWSTFDKQPARVVKVIDGDTIIARSSNGTEEKIRLIGLDAPEMDSRDHWADRSTAYMQARLKDREVTLRLDGTQTRDRYDRLLAYIFITDNDNLNLALVRDGHAYADRRHGHTFRTSFETAVADARKKGRGLWKDVRDDQQPEWRQRWIKERWGK